VSERKPADVSWESWVERQIREAQERGEFDDLAGAGKPIADLDRPYDEMWWIRKKFEEDKLSVLPPALQVRRDLERAREQIDRTGSEQQVRQIIAGINAHIRQTNRTTMHGPPTTVMPLDEERTVREWRKRRAQ
jgi:Domain of unknown function (DUF1992)